MALPMANHLNSLRRMGLDREQCEGVTRVATRVAKWIGVDTKEWKQVGDVVDWTKRV
jgi:NACalpha-BTF3-like transcription factor